MKKNGLMAKKVPRKRMSTEKNRRTHFFLASRQFSPRGSADKVISPLKTTGPRTGGYSLLWSRAVS